MCWLHSSKHKKHKLFLVSHVDNAISSYINHTQTKMACCSLFFLWFMSTKREPVANRYLTFAEPFFKWWDVLFEWNNLQSNEITFVKYETAAAFGKKTNVFACGVLFEVYADFKRPFVNISGDLFRKDGISPSMKGCHFKVKMHIYTYIYICMQSGPAVIYHNLYPRHAHQAVRWEVCIT